MGWDSISAQISNSVKSVIDHLEATIGFLPGALAADTAWGFQILRLLFFHRPVKNSRILLFSSSSKRLWPSYKHFEITNISRLSCGNHFSSCPTFSLASSDCQAGPEGHVHAVWAILVQWDMVFVGSKEHLLQLQIQFQKVELLNNGYIVGYHTVHNNECLNIK